LYRSGNLSVLHFNGGSLRRTLEGKVSAVQEDEAERHKSSWRRMSRETEEDFEEGRVLRKSGRNKKGVVTQVLENTLVGVTLTVPGLK